MSFLTVFLFFISQASSSWLPNIVTDYFNNEPKPVNGGWNVYGDFSKCSKPCGGGYMVRRRLCNRPTPENGGNNCVGSNEDLRKCNTQSCYKNWSNWSKCSKSCGIGHQTRKRECTTQAIINRRLAHLCEPKIERKVCNLGACVVKVNGNWSNWQQYTPCSKSCGGGSQTRYRKCNNPSPQNGGNKCNGLSSSSKLCNIQACKIDGGWSRWTGYGNCDKSCGGGVEVRHRTCTNPKPKNGGKPCVGSAEITEPCNVQPCNVVPKPPASPAGNTEEESSSTYHEEETSGPYVEEECQRVRKPWQMLSADEKQLYLDGVIALHRSNKLKIFSDTHYEDNNNAQAHGTGSFLPWHRYFIWEFESQLRKLGDKYKCIAVPYWDWSLDTGKEHESSLYKTGFGGNGDPNDHYCVKTGTFAKGNYAHTEGDCSIDKEYCCLKRKFCEGEFCVRKTPYPTAAKLMEDVTNNEYYDSFRNAVENHGHASVHIFHENNWDEHVGTQMASMRSPDDPLFFVHHNFVDYQWALWQTCHGYDQVPKKKLHTSRKYFEGEEEWNNDWMTTPGSRLDDKLYYNILKEKSWSYLSNGKILTARDMYDITKWNVIYEKSSFFTRANVNTFCKHAISDKWFTDSGVLNIFADWNYLQETLSIEQKVNNESWLKLRRLEATEHDLKHVHADLMSLQGLGFELTNDIDIPNGMRKDHEMQKMFKKDEFDKTFKNDKKKIVKKWAKDTCWFMTHIDEKDDHDIKECDNAPEHYEKCDTLGIKIPKHFQPTLEFLLEKVHHNKCLSQIRKNFYKFAKWSGKLYDLCNGHYDQRC